jgi:hypothetical protein
MNRLDPNDPGHVRLRTALRTAGAIVFCVGLLLAIISAASLMTSDGEPRWFWLGFVGLPLMFAGGVMGMFGWMGAMARFQAREGAPVATDTFNYMADETKGSVKTLAGAAGEGFREGSRGTRSCPKCGASNDADAKFCKACGAALT